MEYIEKKYASLEEAKASAAITSKYYKPWIFKGVDIGGHNNFRVGVFSRDTGNLLQYECEWVEECHKCGPSLVVSGFECEYEMDWPTFMKAKGGVKLCEKCAIWAEWYKRREEPEIQKKYPLGRGASIPNLLAEN